MTLPQGWRETETRSNRAGTWRFQVRSPKRFRPTTLRTVPLEGIRGVKLIAGKLSAGDRELARHGSDAMVPQAVVFSKADWPQFRDALAWQRDHFTAIDNPPRRIYRGQLRLGSFRAGVDEAIAQLVKTDTELTALMAQALELSQRGAPVPAWILERARGLQLERVAQLEAVKTAVARHGAAIEEFSTPKGRRGNPVRHVRTLSPLAERKMRETELQLATKMFKEFHGGRPPTGYRFQRVPDLSQLVTLGRAVSIDYQLEPHVARGKRNRPYRHAFDRGSTLLTDPTGRALVIVGNVKVSRSPRGRFGYIRAASEA